MSNFSPYDDTAERIIDVNVIVLNKIVLSLNETDLRSPNEVPSGIHAYYDGEQTTFEEVAGICLNKDDPTMPSITIRSFLIGLVFVLIMSFYHMWYYVTNLYAVVTPVLAILISHIIGKVSMLFGSKPWTMKEHTIVLIMSNISWTFAVVYDISVISFLEYQEQRETFHFIHMFFFVVSIQFIGFGLAGMFRII